jgi:hypothetical protein
MVQPKDPEVVVGSGDVCDGQPTANGTTDIPELEGIENSKGQVCIECASCGFAVVRTRSYVLAMRTMKCPMCLQSYTVKL